MEAIHEFHLVVQGKGIIYTEEKGKAYCVLSFECGVPAGSLEEAFRKMKAHVQSGNCSYDNCLLVDTNPDITLKNLLTVQKSKPAPSYFADRVA